jgi:DNA mismatch endonuclease (patch repair protein)
LIPLRRRRDTLSKAQRSLLMSRIRSKNTQLDKSMRKLLRKAGISFKMYPKILGNPDFLVGGKIAIFCDSSFWHGHNWKKLKGRLLLGSNAEYWVEHIARNRRRDRHVTRILRKQGYLVIRMWDKDILKSPEKCASEIRSLMRSRYRGAQGARSGAEDV